MSVTAVRLDNLMFLHEVSTPKQLSDYSFVKNHPTLTPLGERHYTLLVAVHREGYFAVFSTVSPYSYFGTLLGHIAGTSKPIKESVVLEHLRMTERDDWRFFATVYVINKEVLQSILEMTGLVEINDYLLGVRKETDANATGLHSYYRVLHKETNFARWCRLPSGTPDEGVIARIRNSIRENTGKRIDMELGTLRDVTVILRKAAVSDFTITEVQASDHKFLGPRDCKDEVRLLNNDEITTYVRAQSA